MKQNIDASRTLWWCEACHASGLMPLAGLDVYSAVQRLSEAHDQHDIAQWLKCSFSTTQVRVQELPVFSGQPR